MQLSCAFPAGPHVVDYIVEAEGLGYERAWIYDSPALYGDIWVTAALAAQRTTRIGLGPGVVVPNLRHPLTQASAIAQLEQLAPGRIAVAIGTGFTGRNAMGQPALTWKYTRRYIEQLRALLRGEKVEVDGKLVQMLHGPDFAPPFPINVPIIVAAMGPKGTAIAKELGDGLMTVGGGNPEFDSVSVLAFGTVLDEGEPANSERAFAAAGPAMTVVFHAMYEGDPAAVDGLPNGAAWRKQLEAEVPEAERHLEVHRDHLVRVTERDAQLLDGDLLQAFTWTGTADNIRERAAALEAAGATEIMYGPMGPDIPRELAAFQAAVRR